MVISKRYKTPPVVYAILGCFVVEEVIWHVWHNGTLPHFLTKGKRISSAPSTQRKRPLSRRGLRRGTARSLAVVCLHSAVTPPPLRSEVGATRALGSPPDLAIRRRPFAVGYFRFPAPRELLQTSGDRSMAGSIDRQET